MDEKKIMEYANKAIEAFKGDKSLLTGFSTNPTDIIKKIIGIELPEEIILKVIEAVKGLLAGGALGSAMEAVSGITDAAKNAAGAAENIADKAGEAASENGGILSGAIKTIKKLF